MDYKHIGDCHHIAIALHRKYNLPIVFIYGEREEYPEHYCDEDCDEFCDTQYEEYEPSITEYIMIHVGVMEGDNFRDFSGICGTPEEAFREYTEGNQPYDEVDYFFYDSEEDPDFIKRVKKCGSHISEDKIQEFLDKV